MKVYLMAAVAVLALAAPAAAAGVNQGAAGLTAPAGTSRAKVNCNSASSCNQLISKCAERDGNWNPAGYNKEGQPIKGSCSGL
ncbi:MAG: hypothetical protein ABUL48_02535 [Pseudorhodoplanes sp.]